MRKSGQKPLKRMYSLVAYWPCDRWHGIPSPVAFFGPTWWAIKVKLKRDSCAKKLVSRCSSPACEFAWHESRLKIILLCIRIFSFHTIPRANFGSQFSAPTLSIISLLPLSILPNIRHPFSHFAAAILIPAIFTQNLNFPTADSFLATIYICGYFAQYNDPRSQRKYYLLNHLVRRLFWNGAGQRGVISACVATFGSGIELKTAGNVSFA